MTKPPILILAAGGTGGHMFPAQALAEAMLVRGWRVKLSTDRRGARYTRGFPKEVEINVNLSATFARGGAFSSLATPFLIMIGISAMMFKMLVERPCAVVGFGGYPSIPALCAAIVLGTPRMIHEQNGVLGRVNQIFAKRVNKVALGIWPTELPSGTRVVHTGNPVRTAVKEMARVGYTPPGEYPMSVLVIGGSQGARILSDVVPPALMGLPQDVLKFLRISQQARLEDCERVKNSYLKYGISAEVEPFFEDLPTRMSKSQLVISRSGASSVADISVIGRPSILVPLAAAIKQEQHANAHALVERRAAIMVEERDLHVQSLSKILNNFFAEPQRAIDMAKNAKAFGTVDATARLVEEVITLTRKS